MESKVSWIVQETIGWDWLSFDLTWPSHSSKPLTV